MAAPEYPMHEKLKTVATLSQICGEFLEWLECRGLRLAKWEEDGETLVPTQTSRTQLLAEFFEIDLDALEQEKRHMLGVQRKLNVAQR